MLKINFPQTLLFVILCSISFGQEYPRINPENIEIVRDEWGVPHIYGKTDAEAAYGLAWANCEDAFEEVQKMYSVSKPINGRNEGKKGAKTDFFIHFLQTDRIIDEQIKELPEEYLKYIDGYAQGLNSYAKTHKKDVTVKKLFPITSRDVLRLYIVATCSFTKVQNALGDAYEGKLYEHKSGMGSNGIALNKNKTADGKTYLLVNPHMPVHGQFSFYEAQLNSEEGLNIHGTMFMGGTSIYMGSTNNLGWAMTTNHFDQGDIYELVMHPKKKNTYLYDGKWKDLEVIKNKLKVKVGPFVIPVTKKTYWCELGPVIKEGEGEHYYAVRYPAIFDIKAGYQWYKMNKAKNYKEFREALDMISVPMFNIVYADKTGNIFYVSNGKIPVRQDSLVDKKVIAGDQSKNVWSKLHTIEELPHAENPSTGYLFNTNNSPFHYTKELDKKAKENSPRYMDTYPGNNNRATRFLELIESKDKIDFDFFQKIKFDSKISRKTYLVKQLDVLFNMKPTDYPEIEEFLTIIQAWDFEVDSNDIAAALFMGVMNEIFTEKHYGGEQFADGFDASKEDIIRAVKNTQSWLIDNYGTIKVPIKTVFIAKKGDRMMSPPGFGDALSANYGEKKGNIYELRYGDAYIHFVKFNENGVEELRTAVPFGTSNNPDSPHFFDQAELFKKQETKPMTMNKEEVYKKAKKIYHPE